jgi:autoinducer 2-degrading protein
MMIYLLLLAYHFCFVPSVTSFSVASSSSLSAFALNIRLVVKPSRTDEFIALIQTNQRATLTTEPDALAYVFGKDVSEPNVFYIHEQFKSQQGFEHHKSTNHNQKYSAFRDTDPYDKDPALDCYTILEPTATTATLATTTTTPRTAAQSTFCVHVEVCVKESRRSDFLQCIAQNQKGSRAQEPKCLQYVYGESVDQANRFVFYEEYTDKEGFDAHTQTPHFAVWQEFVATEPFTTDPVVHFYETI